MYNNGTVSNSTTTNYTYGDTTWGDLLTEYDGEGITYDSVGNPLSYYNGKRYTFSWQYGRRLTGAVVDGKTNTYTYNMDGIRLTKTADGVEHTYYYDGSQLIAETWGNSYLRFTYDENGTLLRVYYHNGTTTTMYYYVLNLQGDVLEIRDTANNVVCRYSYDAWGKILSIKDGNGNAITAVEHIGNINPMRYRGYYYDTETGLYYLQSRYYDPVVGRFISPDTYISTGQGLVGYNRFAYCNNNPIIYVDFNGMEAVKLPHGRNINAILSGNFEDKAWYERSALWDEDFALYDNDRFSDDNSFFERVISGTARGPSLDFKEGNIGLGSLSVDLINGGWRWKYVELDVFNIFHAEVSAEMENYNTVNLGALASCWSPSVTFYIFGTSVTIGAEVGAIGGKISYEKGKFTIGAAYKCGLSISIG